jgi:hypothetical protein
VFDVSADPSETQNLLDQNNSDYYELFDLYSDNCREWSQKTIKAIVPDDNGKSVAWKNCGGVCSWVEKDFEPLEIKEIYNQKEDSFVPPHIIFVLVDDWGWNDVGFRSTYLPWNTPTIDRLASEGILLNNYYTHSTCVPSRGALMTGRFASRLGEKPIQPYGFCLTDLF